MLLDRGTFIQLHKKYKCNAYKLKGEHEFMKININNLVNKSFASIYELKGEHELMQISPSDLVNRSFEGSCIVEVYDDYCDSCKSTILFVQEIYVTRPTSPCKVVWNTGFNVRVRRRVITRIKRSTSNP